jgi:hypothetical protein
MEKNKLCLLFLLEIVLAWNKAAITITVKFLMAERLEIVFVQLFPLPNNGLKI